MMAAKRMRPIQFATLVPAIADAVHQPLSTTDCIRNLHGLW